MWFFVTFEKVNWCTMRQMVEVFHALQQGTQHAEALYFHILWVPLGQIIFLFFSFVVSSTAYTAEACENKSNRYHLYWNKKNIKIWLLIGSMNAMYDCRFPTLKEQLRKYNQRSAISLQLTWHFNHCGLYIQIFYEVDISKCKYALCTENERNAIQL